MDNNRLLFRNEEGSLFKTDRLITIFVWGWKKCYCGDDVVTDARCGENGNVRRGNNGHRSNYKYSSTVEAASIPRNPSHLENGAWTSLRKITSYDAEIPRGALSLIGSKKYVSIVFPPSSMMSPKSWFCFCIACCFLIFTCVQIEATAFPETLLFLHRFLCGLPHRMLSFESI